MTEFVLLGLQILKVAAIVAGVIGITIVLVYMIDLLKEEWQILSEKWVRPDKAAVDQAWGQYFFEDIGRHRVDKKSAYVHPFIAVRPRLHRYTIRLETVDA